MVRISFNMEYGTISSVQIFKPCPSPGRKLISPLGSFTISESTRAERNGIRPDAREDVSAKQRLSPSSTPPLLRPARFKLAFPYVQHVPQLVRSYIDVTRSSRDPRRVRSVMYPPTSHSPLVSPNFDMNSTDPGT